MTDLSVIIPARNEQFLAQTIDNLCANLRGNTEIICVLDGNWPDPPVADRPRPNVHLIYHSQSIGQRQAVNEAARLSTAKYIMKVDAHCAFDEGFDVKLMADCEPSWTVIPRMFNLHAFDWACQGCGARTYQGPQPKECKCGATEFEQVIVWQRRLSRKTDFARFDSNLKFQYWGEFGSRPEEQGDIADTLCFVGACFFMERDRYWQLGGLDERHGSWGQMGVEISCKSWLSGGRQVVNKKTWFAHMFRTQPGFGFPYPNSGSAVEKARKHSRWLWQGNNWEGAKYPLSWLIDKFSPVPDWGEKQPAPTKAAIWYTDNRLDEARIGQASRRQLSQSLNGHELISVSLKPLDFGRNISLGLERGYLTMFKQILAGLEATTAEVVFLCEHDVIYHPSHFEFNPPRRDVYYYNENVWKIRAEDGHALFYYCQQTSGLCAYRDLLLKHYRRRVELVEQNGFSRKMGFEPGTHNRSERVDDYKAESWMSEYPNLDIRHDKNLTPNRWSQDQFRNKRYCRGWLEKDTVPGWGKTAGEFDKLLENILTEGAL